MRFFNTPLKWALVASFVGGSVFAQPSEVKNPNTPTKEVKTTPVLTPVLHRAQSELRKIIDKVSPSVVTIFAVKEVKVETIPPGFEDFFRMIPPELRPYLGPFGQPKVKKERALGSGFMFKADDKWVYILTNNHVVANAKKITVKIGRLKEVRAQIVGTDPKTDLAVLKIPRTEVSDVQKRLAKLGDSSKVKVGDLVVAIGNPFGLEDTATFGIVSAIHRRIGLDQYENFIQTQAPINPGNSGGPLVNIDGEVIGINTAIIANAQGLGFAIPINLAKWVADQLIEHGKVVRGWLGVVVQELTPAVAEALGLNHGVIVLKVVPGSPASKAGLQPGDIILAVNGKPIENASQLQFEIMKTKPGTEITLTVMRGEKRLDLKVRIEELPSPKELKRMKEIYYNLGLVLRNASKEDLEQFKAPYGVVVENVYPGSPAYAAGLRPGMLIERVNNIPVRSVEDFKKVVSKLAAEKKPIVLWVKNYRGELQLITIEDY